MQDIDPAAIEIKSEDMLYNPEFNAAAISIIKQADGNYIGKMQKHGKLVEARQGDPHTVLEMLITHDGI